MHPLCKHVLLDCLIEAIGHSGVLVCVGGGRLVPDTLVTHPLVECRAAILHAVIVPDGQDAFPRHILPEVEHPHKSVRGLPILGDGRDDLVPAVVVNRHHHVPPPLWGGDRPGTDHVRVHEH